MRQPHSTSSTSPDTPRFPALLRSRRLSGILVAALVIGLAAFGLQPLAVADSGHEHHGHDVPADEIILADLMQLMNAKFGKVRTEGGKIAVDAEAKHEVTEATQDAQRYLRVAKQDFAPDPGFIDFADEAIGKWATLESAAKAGDVEALKSGIQALGGACKACHDVYRQEH